MDNKYNIVRLVLQSGVQTIFFRVLDWSVDEVVKLVSESDYELNDFRFFWFEARERSIERDNGVELLRIETRTMKSSGNYFINSYTETIDDIAARNDKDEYWLVEKMKNLGWERVVTSVEPKEDWHYNFKECDCLVDLEGKMV